MKQGLKNVPTPTEYLATLPKGTARTTILTSVYIILTLYLQYNSTTTKLSHLYRRSSGHRPPRACSHGLQNDPKKIDREGNRNQDLDVTSCRPGNCLSTPLLLYPTY
jgi:hypothetical protein